ncbi:MAG: hypothetical protein JRJ84_22250 [Deltaproteobacteria bacterium]|nr:hypothetical protein [Deltaproteobacteria bacterium]
MTWLHLLHVIFLGLWGGIVASETVVEFSAKSDEDHRHAARLHYWIDLLVEFPVLLGILATGGWLAWRIALVVLAVNFWCLALVVRRQRHREDPKAVRALAHKVRSAWLAVPLAGVALYLGLDRFWF